MKNRSGLPLFQAMFLAILFSPSLLPAQSSDSFEVKRLANVNVSIQIESGSSSRAGLSSTGRRYEILATADGTTSKLSTGARVPIPVTTRSGRGASDAIVQSIQYQDVGFTAEVTVRLVDFGYIVDAKIEDSQLQEAKEGNLHPVVHHHTYRVRGVLSLGETLVASSNSTEKYRVTLGLEEGTSGR